MSAASTVHDALLGLVCGGLVSVGMVMLVAAIVWRQRRDEGPDPRHPSQWVDPETRDLQQQRGKDFVG